ncbi:hypothetical protein [Flavobacterium litorale]|uniref:SnoaL-like domain-containing protein n=1 Tax=Flavobacterium litorale TaxID=2856519 RepID=A0ABX8V7P2_9FLAO|nr:hypothetical protein [Flavobacterium litorale]QYJ68868.1 hypothetical protein K1I41_03010 [Flavobacterium litorale]
MQLNTIKHITLLFFVSIIVLGCSSTKKENKVAENYEIAQLALKYIENYEKFRLIEEPTFMVIRDYYDGFTADFTIDLTDHKFTFLGKQVTKWERKHFKDKAIKRKLEIIEDFEKVPKVSFHHPEKSDPYLTMSPPLFSDNGEYAVINLNVLSNLEISNMIGYTLVYRRVNGKWELFVAYEPYLT